MIAVANMGPEMRVDGFAEAKVPSGVLRCENQGLAVWRNALDTGSMEVWGLMTATDELHSRTRPRDALQEEANREEA